MTDNPPQHDGSRWTWQFTVAIVLLAAFLVLVGIMIWFSGSGAETVWQRRVYLFGAVEAIVFTAVGWLFGSEVHRAEARNARQDAEVAKTEAKENADAAADAEKRLTAEQEKGHTAAAAVRHTEAAPGQGSRQGRSSEINAGPRPAGPAESSTINLRALFDELYPRRE